MQLKADRTADEIIASFQASLADLEALDREDYVVGWLDNALCVGTDDNGKPITGGLTARGVQWVKPLSLIDAVDVASKVITNGRGEVAQIIRRGEMIDRSIHNLNNVIANLQAMEN
jgi:hypothetical protein